MDDVRFGPLRPALATVLLLAALAVPLAAAATPRTSLVVTVWPEGRPGPAATWTVRCAPPRGTLANRVAACAQLRALPRSVFAPVPRDLVCIQRYFGSEVAHVRGLLRGKRVAGWFRRSDGCENARWLRIGFLVPGADR